MRLIDLRTADGSRQFARLPKAAAWDTLREHFARLPGLEIINFVVERVPTPWLDFIYRGHRFTVRDAGEEVWLMVADPQCSDVLLYETAAHCEQLLGSGAAA
jgi:hypothetical protein